VQACALYVGAASLAEFRNRTNRERISKWVEEDFKMYISKRYKKK